MIETFLLVFLVAIVLIGLAVAAMAVGAVFSGRCLRGSCGGPALTLADGEKLRCHGCPNRSPADNH